MMSTDYERIFPATLGTRERLLTYAVGYGVGIGLPAVLAVLFAIVFSHPLILLAPLPFLLAFGAPYYWRPTGYAVATGEIAVIRRIGRKSIPLERVREALFPATTPPGSSIGLARVEGIHGTFGSYWNKSWGRYHIYVTNHANSVELRLEDGSRVILSPDDPMSFILEVRTAASERGVVIDADCL